MTPALALEDAQQRLLALAQPLGAETIAISDALGRTLAQDVCAVRTQPAADLSAMDGYALCGEGPWKVTGESRAGHPFLGDLKAGQAARISTGAVMPSGAETVLLQEDTARSGDVIDAVGTPPAPGAHIRRSGFDFRAGDTLLCAGARITPAAIAVGLSGGLASVEVTRRPRAVFIDTGDELAQPGTPCAAHQIPASNSAMLAAMAAQIPCDNTRTGPVPDRLDALVDAISSASNADLIVTTGGASVGDHDLIRPALEAMGASLDFWRVAIKPGKPLLVAQRGRQVIISLPGNPVSAYVTGFLFVLPFLRALSGARAPVPEPLMLPLAVPLGPGGVRREFIRGTLSQNGVTPLDQTDSSALRTLAAANVLIERAANADGAKAGTPVPVYLLGNG